MATSWTNPYSFLGEILEMVCYHLVSRVDREKLAPDQSADVEPKTELECTFSWILSWCFNHYIKLALIHTHLITEHQS